MPPMQAIRKNHKLAWNLNLTAFLLIADDDVGDNDDSDKENIPPETTNVC